MKTCFCNRSPVALLVVCSVLVAPLSLPLLAEEGAAPGNTRPTLAGLEPSQIPEEFRGMAAPQTTVADFYYGGRFVTSAMVTYTPDTITLTDPRALLERIGTISHLDKVEAALSGRIFSNPGQVCWRADDTRCGRLNPEVAGVIFDASRFRGDIFIAEPYLQVQTLNQSKYLPDSSSSLGLIQGLSAVTSGVTASDDDQSSYSLFGNTLLGWQENHLVANWDYNQDSRFQIDTFYLERDARGLQMGAGYLDYSGMMTPEFSRSQQVFGVKLGSSMNSRLDVADVNSTPIRIFTTGRRRVEVFRDNRLIYAGSVDAGSQEIDTGSFPQGSYQVTIRIYDGPVLEQEITRFFTKSVRLPPSDEIIWYLEGGEMTERNQDTLPENIGEWLLKGGAAGRVTDNSSIELRSSATREQQVVEAEYFHQGDEWDIAITGMAGSDRARGLALETAFSVGPVYLSYYHQRLWNDEFSPDQNAEEDAQVTLLEESYENRSLSASMEFLGGSLSGSYSYNRQMTDNSSSDDADTIYSLSWSRNVGRFNDFDLDLEMDYSESDEDKNATLGVTLRHNAPNWDVNIRGENRWEDNREQDVASDFGYALDSRWYRDDILNGTGELGMRYEDLARDQKILGGNVKYEHARFLAEFTADHISPEQSNQDSYINYNGRIDTSFAVNGQGAGLGGGNRADSALMVAIDGSPSAQFDVLVNGSAVGIAKGNSKTVVPLSPYGIYRVGIRPRGNEFYRYDQGERNITLYPGNVEVVDFSAAEEVVLLGKLVDGQGGALVNAAIQSEVGFVRTDRFGIFQVNLPPSDKYFQVKLADGQSCGAEIPKSYQKRGGVGMVGVLECRQKAVRE